MKKSGNSNDRPGSGRPKASGGKKPTGKRIGKSKPSKANKWESSLMEHLQWSDTITNRESKERLARMIAMRVQEGEVIGAGSGSTVYLALLAIAERIRTENLHVTVIPASMEISMECVRLGIPQTTLWMCRPDWTFDGADEDAAYEAISNFMKENL